MNRRDNVQCLDVIPISQLRPFSLREPDVPDAPRRPVLLRIPITLRELTVLDFAIWQYLVHYFRPGVIPPPAAKFANVSCFRAKSALIPAKPILNEGDP